MRRFALVIGSLFLVTLVGVAQEKPLSQSDLLRLSRGGVSQQRIVQLVHEHGIDFDPNTTSENELRAGGFEEPTIAALRGAAAERHQKAGDALMDQGQFAAAESEYRASLTYDPERQETETRIATSLRALYLRDLRPLADPDALPFYRAAADKGRTWAQTLLGMAYEGGLSVTKDPFQAASYYQAAAAKDEAWAEYRLGVMYEGNGLSRDDAQAAKYLRLAAAAGVSKAQYELALCYREGRGIAKDDGEAQKWMTRSADAGYAPAVASLKASAASNEANPYDESAESRLVEAITAARSSAGLAPLQWDPRLRDTARFHATFVQSNNRVGYQFTGEPDLHGRMSAMSVSEDFVEENVAINPSADEEAKRFLENPATRKNILDPTLTQFGVGVLRGQDGKLYMVEDFARGLAAESIPEVEEHVSKAVNEARKQHRLVPLRLVEDNSLRETACSMADKDSVDTKQVGTLALARQASNVNTHTNMLTQSRLFTYTTYQPGQLPQQFGSMGAEPSMTAMSVGACFKKSPSYPQGVFWVTIVVFYKNLDSQR